GERQPRVRLSRCGQSRRDAERDQSARRGDTHRRRLRGRTGAHLSSGRMRAVRAILRDTAGLTVVEVIIAVGVILVGLLALIATMPLATSSIAESSLKTTATFLA